MDRKENPWQTDDQRRPAGCLLVLFSVPAVAVVGLLLFGIVDYLVASYVPPGTRDYMHKQCRLRGGIHGSRPIHAKGFLITWKDFPAGRDPLDYRYFTDLGMEYMEYSIGAIQQVERWDSTPNGGALARVIKSPYVRITVSERGDPKCRMWDDEYPDQASTNAFLKKIGFDPKRCLALTPIWNRKDLWSPVEYRLRWVPDANAPVPFEWSAVEYVDRRTGKVLVDKRGFDVCITRKIHAPGEGLVDCVDHSRESPTIMQCPPDMKTLKRWHEIIRWQAINDTTD